MVLDETLFDPLLAPWERGIGAVTVPKEAMKAKAMVKRQREEDAVAPKRKLRRTASMKLSSQNEGLWGDIVANGSVVEEVKRKEWDDSLPDQNEARSTEPVDASNRSNDLNVQVPKAAVKDGIFAGKMFYMHGFDEHKVCASPLRDPSQYADTLQAPILKRHLESHDSEIVSDVTELYETSDAVEPASHIIVPHNASQNDVPPTQDPSSQVMSIVTDLWVEKCLFRKKYIDPTTNVAYAPFQWPLQGISCPKGLCSIPLTVSRIL